MKKYFVLFLLVSFCSGLTKGQNPAPAKPQNQPILIVGATAHLGNGKVIENSVVAFEAREDHACC